MTHADCRIYLVVEAEPAALARLTAAIGAADVACCLILPTAGAAAAERAAAGAIVEAAQGAGLAALLADDAELARTLGADGVHFSPARNVLGLYTAARQALGPQAIIGADAGISRHDAMSLAEAGADYIAFGAPARVADRARARERRDDLVTWWGEIFEVPCVALDVDTAREAERLAQAGADFVAVRLPTGASAASVHDLVAGIGAAIGAGEHCA